MSMFPNTDKTKTPYKFSRKQVSGLLKKYLPMLKMQAGDAYDVLAFTFKFYDNMRAKTFTTRFVIVHRHADGAILIYEDRKNMWGGTRFEYFNVDGRNSRVDVCETLTDFEEFVARISYDAERHVSIQSELTQVPLEYASICDKPVKDANGEYIRLPLTTLNGTYKHKKGDFERYSARMQERWEKYWDAAQILLDMNPALDPFYLGIA